MAARRGDHVYATPTAGALVLAHSLRDAGTTKELAALVTLDTVSAEVITQLKTVYNHIISVPRIRNEKPANLDLMNRPDLHSAFTKVNLWKQTQFSKIVYLDADVLAYRAPDELFDLAAPFSAAPDIGWPDLFNTGVMAITPNLGDYYALMAMADRGISFDGADQGLLNMHFGSNYNRISFTYNVTPSAHYQYVPAYRHFQSSINMVHFIGSIKPWFEGRDAHRSDNPFDQMFGRWWAVYDRHYRVSEPHSPTSTSAPDTTPTESIQQPAPELVQYFTKGEFQPDIQHQTQDEPHQATTGEHYRQGTSYGPSQGNQTQHAHHDEPSHHVAPPPPHSSASFGSSSEPQAEARPEQVQAQDGRGQTPTPVEPPHQPPSPAKTWDAQRQAPPAGSKPEALNFPHQVYEMSQDPAPFVPPERYPSPPKDMWYEVPKEKPAPLSEKPPVIFPWETHQPRPSRVFSRTPMAPEDTSVSIGEHGAPSHHQAAAESSVADTSTTGRTSEPATPATPTIKISPSDPWTAFSRSNAWDEVPEIERYVEGLQQHRRTKSQGMTGVSRGRGKPQERGFKLTDFPSEVDRPSLPVTPAPVRRPKFWGAGEPGTGLGEDDEELPAAEGVPVQSDWDPSEQLQKLAKQQSEALLRKLGRGDGDDSHGVSRDIPDRSLPYGSEGVISPTYVAQSAGGVLSPQPVKGSTTTSIVRSMGSDSEPSTAEGYAGTTSGIPEPSYHGPGAAWEKGENVATFETPALPTDEDRDLFDA
ncbi:family 8 glycosyl transferase [Plectosphaerella plurivora]|uniref:glycogenin glucosyltransferase n=1 Tax=Plectosphaerella plurivora TaxID=936078 RepID=A0A9P9A725_9PEZI|nr:family 8 glycosyl transferase [Plectosphaerella plurivora]